MFTLAGFFFGAFCYVEISKDGWGDGSLVIFVTCVFAALFYWIAGV